jgi:hypothetical protein
MHMHQYLEHQHAWGPRGYMLNKAGFITQGSLLLVLVLVLVLVLDCAIGHRLSAICAASDYYNAITSAAAAVLHCCCHLVCRSRQGR